MAFSYTNKKGHKVTLLNPSEKGKKFADELRSGVKITNDRDIKRDKNGDYVGLTDEARAYRSGYLDAQKDSANAWKAKQKKLKR